MGKKIAISCLPVAGIKNPYQYLMIKGLQSDSRLCVKSGIDDRFLGILRTAAKHRPDYIHFDWETSFYYRKKLWMTLINIPIFFLQLYGAKYIFNCKLVWTPHNLVPHDPENLRIHRFCRRLFATHMEWIRLFSESSVANAAHEFKCKTTKFKIIPEGSYIDYYPNNISREEARKLLNIEPNQKVILYIGFIKPYKGIMEMVECFKKIMDVNSILIIAGKSMDKYYFDSLKKIINKRVVVKDRFIENKELQVFFNAADVVCLPFKKIENSGSVILSMGFKKAIIAPRMGVIPARLENQPELLYNLSVEESFKKLVDYSNEKLLQIGIVNFNSLSNNSWADFALAF